MVSLSRTLTNIRRAGLKQWFRYTWYIGDAKYGEQVGTDQFGNRYFENRNPTEEVPGESVASPYPGTRTEPSLSQGRHRWMDFAQVGAPSL